MTEAAPLLGDSNGSISPPRTYDSAVISLPVTSTNNTDHRKWNSLKAIFQLLLLLLAATSMVYLVLKVFLPPLNEEQKRSIHLPKGIEDLQLLNKVLAEYMDQYYYNVMTVYVTVYIYLQTFSIPGSMWLSILGGALFHFVTALLLVCLCSAIGATNCYLLSHKYGKTFVRENFSERLDQWAEKLQAHSHNLLNYLIVLRLSPLPPNWLANIAAPHVGVPLKIFFIGTFVGVAAPSLIHVQAGLTIEHLTNASDFKIFTFTNVCALVLVALAVLLPVWFRRKFKENEHRLSDENTPQIAQVA